jgi:hypothetical protein
LRFPRTLTRNGRITLQLRAWDEHSFIVRLFFPTPFSSGVGLVGLPTARVQRGPSEAARCASTGDHQASPILPLLHLRLFPSYNDELQANPLAF